MTNRWRCQPFNMGLWQWHTFLLRYSLKSFLASSPLNLLCLALNNDTYTEYITVNIDYFIEQYSFSPAPKCFFAYGHYKNIYTNTEDNNHFKNNIYIYIYWLTDKCI